MFSVYGWVFSVQHLKSFFQCKALSLVVDCTLLLLYLFPRPFTSFVFFFFGHRGLQLIVVTLEAVGMLQGKAAVKEHSPSD